MEIHQGTGRETEGLPLDLRLAAIVTLLSSSALSGRTPGKAGALRHHLEAAILAAENARHAHLANALRQVLQGWLGACPVFPAREEISSRASGQWLH